MFSRRGKWLSVWPSSKGTEVTGLEDPSRKRQQIISTMNFPIPCNIPVVEKIPPTIPQSLTKNCQNGMCSSVTVTIRELRSYFINIPETPWLPAAWLMMRSYREAKGGKRKEEVRTKSRHLGTCIHSTPSPVAPLGKAIPVYECSPGSLF